MAKTPRKRKKDADEAYKEPRAHLKRLPGRPKKSKDAAPRTRRKKDPAKKAPAKDRTAYFSQRRRMAKLASKGQWTDQKVYNALMAACKKTRKEVLR